VKLRLPAALSKRALEIARANQALLSNAASMVGTAIVTSLPGAAFWLVAPH